MYHNVVYLRVIAYIARNKPYFRYRGYSLQWNVLNLRIAGIIAYRHRGPKPFAVRAAEGRS